MFVAYVIVTVIAIVVNVAITVADLVRAEFVVANSTKVGVPTSWIPWLAVPKAAGAAGLLLGLMGVPFIGMAAALGLVLFFVGAVTVHIRARVFHNLAFPGVFLGLAIASLVLSAVR
ncbi:DoxX family protein [Actinomadura sp. 6N118]|uniref:DoxX family protein n=1 Tax=Actinomadura sp. 6N118 TaxID=3375151 RepID=UPI0037B079FA